MTVSINLPKLCPGQPTPPKKNPLHSRANCVRGTPPTHTQPLCTLAQTVSGAPPPTHTQTLCTLTQTVSGAPLPVTPSHPAFPSARGGRQAEAPAEGPRHPLLEVGGGGSRRWWREQAFPSWPRDRFRAVLLYLSLIKPGSWAPCPGDGGAPGWGTWMAHLDGGAPACLPGLLEGAGPVWTVSSISTHKTAHTSTALSAQTAPGGPHTPPLPSRHKLLRGGPRTSPLPSRHKLLRGARIHLPCPLVTSLPASRPMGV
jgi:hypothetical protein